MLMQECKRALGAGDDHQIVDEIVTTFLPETVRQAYRELTDGVSWWYV